MNERKLLIAYCLLLIVLYAACVFHYGTSTDVEIKFNKKDTTNHEN